MPLLLIEASPECGALSSLQGVGALSGAEEPQTAPCPVGLLRLVEEGECGIPQPSSVIWVLYM